MSEFYYIISFIVENESYQLNINVEYENYLVPVYNCEFCENEIKHIFNQINEYLHHTNLKMTKKDIILFYNTFKQYDIIIPTPLSVNELNEEIHLSKELTPKEMLFLMYINHKGVKSKKAKYWLEEYHFDILQAIDKLLDLGYLTKDDYMFNVNKATKKELSDVLNKKNISINGNKSEIIDKVLDAMSVEELKKHFSGLYYNNTIKGEQITIQNQFLNDFHKSYYRYANQLKIEEFYILKKRYKDLDTKDVCKIMVDKKNDQTLNEFDWDQFFEEEVKSNKPVNDFLDIINKYSNNRNVEKKEVSEEEFLNIVYKGNCNKINEIIKNKKMNENTSTIQTIEYDTIIPCKMEKIKDQEIETFFVKNRNTHDKENQVEIGNKSFKTMKIGLFFIRNFIYSSIICFIVIFILYRFIFE